MLEFKNPKNQYLASILSVCLLSGLCLIVRDIIDYKIIGYLLLVLVSVLAIFLEIKPVLLGAVLSALALDYLFIKPYHTLHIDSAEDALLLLLFFIIALINGVLTNNFRRMQRAINIKETRASTVKLYNTMLDSLSRELKAPITTILGSIYTLQQKDVNVSQDKQQNLLSEMEKASLKLNYQVENLLNMSRLESGVIQPKLDWCDVKEIIYNVCNRLVEETKDHKIKYQIEENLPLFKLDYGLMKQIVYNLVYNCIQHTPKGTGIKIKVNYEVDPDFENHVDLIKKCVIIIADNGYGFPKDEINRAFDKFYRFKNSKTSGAGLGLSIVKGFVQAQNGTISLQNAEEGGAVFTLEFKVDCKPINSLDNK